ncbi:hypothetical protein ES705_32238 [subsurface metagenome]
MLPNIAASCSAVASLSFSITPVIPIVFKVLVSNTKPNLSNASFAASTVGVKNVFNTPCTAVIVSSVLRPALVTVAIIAPKSSKLNPAMLAVAATFPIEGANSAKVVLPSLTMANNLSLTVPAWSALIP